MLMSREKEKMEVHTTEYKLFESFLRSNERVTRAVYEKKKHTGDMGSGQKPNIFLVHDIALCLALHME